ncbi:MAG: cell division protein ZapA [Leptothrix sp. (in: b-proteobacteria)]
MRQLEVTIMGQSYILACPAGRETMLLEAVGAVDREMCAIRDAGKVKARERIAVLAALNLAYALAEQQQPAAADDSRSTEPLPLPPNLPLPPELDALLRRVDAALGHDGQLI